MDVGKMFNLPKLGGQANKRKLPNTPSPDMISKMSRTEGQDEGQMAPPPVPSPLSSTTKGKQRATAITDVADEDDPVQQAQSQEQDQDEADAPDFAPGNDADYFAEEDSDGRFFGGGLTDEQKEILQIMDKDGADAGDDVDLDANVLTLPAVRKHLANLEKAINTNREMRVKHADDPTRFVDSEVSLDSALHSLLLFTQDAGSFYPEIVRSKAMYNIVDLLLHENTDISMSVVEVLEELTDEDVGEEEQEDEEQRPGEPSKPKADARDGVRVLIEAALENSILPNLFAHLSRLSEDDETERNGVYHVLSLIENIISAYPSVTYQLLKQTTILSWLTEQIHKKPVDGGSGEDLGAQNRQYAGEILAIVLQGGVDDNEIGFIKEEFGKSGGMDKLLVVLSVYRKKDPKDAEEVEFMENLFDGLCASLATEANKKRFLDHEGVELMIIMMKEKKMAQMRAVKVLNYALSTEAGTSVCIRFVDNLGLKSFFPIYMRGGASGEGRKKVQRATSATEDEEHILGILVALLSNLDSESPERIRLLGKFVEADYSKVDRLLEMRDTILERVQGKEKDLKSEFQILQKEGIEVDEDEIYLRRLEAGLFSLQLIDYILAWIVMEDDGIRDHASMLLKRMGHSFGQVVEVLEEYKDNIGDGDDEHDGGDTSKAITQKEIVANLVAYLKEL